MHKGAPDMSRLPRGPHFISVRWEMGQIGEDGVGMTRPPSNFARWGEELYCCDLPPLLTILSLFLLRGPRILPKSM